ncbi:hypothetical protein F2P81_005249 [Scophthalmus maximus]|uniref:Uncharacterized protein n=1 Tax=Scophthalmus maximus TaxID=52904 RepID=A0A6A4T5Z3_SCOMX|nr:hypothetical protein F2P81_005249 [Scophthalmus maximus]
MKVSRREKNPVLESLGVSHVTVLGSTALPCEEGCASCECVSHTRQKKRRTQGRTQKETIAQRALSAFPAGNLTCGEKSSAFVRFSSSPLGPPMLLKNEGYIQYKLYVSETHRFESDHLDVVKWVLPIGRHRAATLLLNVDSSSPSQLRQRPLKGHADANLRSSLL